MIKAFLSHSSAQKKFIEKVAETLGRDNCFVDEYTFENGMKTMDEIVKSIANSALFVFFYFKRIFGFGLGKRRTVKRKRLCR